MLRTHLSKESDIEKLIKKTGRLTSTVTSNRSCQEIASLGSLMRRERERAVTPATSLAGFAPSVPRNELTRLPNHQTVGTGRNRLEKEP